MMMTGILYTLIKDIASSNDVKRADIFDNLFDLLSSISSFQNEKQKEVWEVVWNYAPEERNRNNYVVLRNLGATCYMNALFQQLFMIPAFKNGVLSSFLTSQKKTSLLDEFRNLFCAFRMEDPQGQKLNPFVQMDVDEFLNALFDQLENNLIVKERDLLHLFQGKLLHRIQSSNCWHISEHEETFNVLQLEVKNNNSLEDALRQYIQEDLLNGDNQYYCDQCKSKVDAEKKTSLKELPPYLIFHLKRFDYDLEIMQRRKIDDYFEFPFSIDMSSYLYENVQSKDEWPQEENLQKNEVEEKKNETQYELRGVIVHTGTAESGHYYSFIKEREGKGRWFQFNDTVVIEIEANQIGPNCFGGLDDNKYYKQYSAYMLIYDQNDYSSDIITDKYESSLKEEVEMDNLKFAQFQLLHSSHLFELVLQFLKHLNRNPGLIEHQKILRNMTQYFLQIVLHSKEHEKLFQFMEEYTKLFSSLDDIYFFIHSSRSHIKQLLMECPIAKVRLLFAQFYFHIFNQLSFDKQISLLAFFLSLLQPKNNWKFLDAFWMFILQSSRLNENIKEYLIKNHLLNLTRLFFQIQQQQPREEEENSDRKSKKMKMSQGETEQNFSTLLNELLADCKDIVYKDDDDDSSD